MRIAAWNLNHRVGRTRYRPEAPNAAIALQADILVFTEFFPRHHESTFRTVLADAGYFQQLISDRPDEIANRVLIASVEPVEPLPLDLPTFDRQFPANLLAFRAPAHGLSVVAVRVPSYVKAEAGLVHRAWDWLESTAATLKSTPAVIIGDLNATPSVPGRTGRQFRGIVESGWILGAPRGGAVISGQEVREAKSIMCW